MLEIIFCQYFIRNIQLNKTAHVDAAVNLSYIAITYYCLKHPANVQTKGRMSLKVKSSIFTVIDKLI